MTRRMPVLPATYCGNCQHVGCYTSRGETVAYCDIHGEPLRPVHPIRTVYCVRDELAWRNVAAGLFAAAVSLSTEYGFGVVEQYWCIRKNFGDDDCTCKWCKPVPDAQKPAPA